MLANLRRRALEQKLKGIFRFRKDRNGLTQEEIYEGINSGKFLISTLSFAFGFAVMTNCLTSMYPFFALQEEGWVRSSRGAAFGAVWCLVTIFFTNRELKKIKARRLDDQITGLIVLSRYATETVAALTQTSQILRCVRVIDTESSRPNYVASNQNESVQRQLDQLQGLAIKDRIAVDRDSPDDIITAIFNTLVEFESRGVLRRSTVLDVTDVPGDIFARLVQEYGSHIKAFQVIPKRLSPSGKQKLGTMTAFGDADYETLAPVRFRTTDIRVDWPLNT
ncbi:hypothetical protein MCEMSE15_00096 [Fimbriimonadaceae bacterium]